MKFVLDIGDQQVFRIDGWHGDDEFAAGSHNAAALIEEMIDLD